MNRFVTSAVLCAVLGFGQSGAHAQSASDAARPAKVFTVTADETELLREYPAIALPSQEVELSFRVSGRVIELPVLAAQTVEEGDVIAQLDPRDFQSNVAQLESQLDQAKAQLTALQVGARTEEIAALEAAVAAAQAQVNQLQDQVNRTQQLVDRSVASQAQLDAETSQLRVAEASLQAEQERLRIGQAGGRAEDIDAAEAVVRGLQAQLDAANDNLADTTLRAPFTGIVARRDIENFTNIQAGQTIVLLQELSTIDVTFDIPANDVVIFAATGVDQVSSQTMFEALPGEIFDAEFVEFTTQADAATQTYRGRASVSVPEGSFILPGMVARVFATAPLNGEAMLRVPLTAIASAPDGSPFVWVVNPGDNSVSSQPISMGDASGDSVRVTEGLAAGDVVVSAGVSQLQEGMTVRPVTQIGG